MSAFAARAAILRSKFRSGFVSALAVCILAASATAQTRSDFFIHTPSGDSLDATSFTPPALPPSKGYPALLLIHGFGADKSTRIPSCKIYAANGYFTLAYTVRGHGKSSGLSSIMSTPERQDLHTVLDYLKHLPNVDSNAIGIVGSSQGGLHGLWAAVDHLNVRAVCADAIVPQWASDMLSNGSIRRTMLLLLKTTSVRYAPVRDTLVRYVMHDDYDSLVLRFPVSRDVDTAVLSRSDVPRETFLKWQDHYFSPENGIAAFLNQSSPGELYVGTQGHFSDDDSAETYVQSDLTFRWFGRFLMHRESGILREPPVVLAYSSLPADTSGRFHWSHLRMDAYPDKSTSMLRLYFHPDSTISTHRDDRTASPFVLENRYLDTTYTIEKGFIEGFRGAHFEKILPQSSIVFTSAPLDSSMFWVGQPEMHLYLSSRDSEFPLHAQIYEVDTAGKQYFINRINYIARHWDTRSPREIDVRGIPHAHLFSKGSRIRIILTNIDKSNRKILGSYPFVLPVFRNAGVSLLFNPKHPSSLSLPVVGRLPGLK